MTATFNHLEEARRWIAEKGSTRLRKAADLDLLRQSWRTYCDERVGVDHDELIADGWIVGEVKLDAKAIYDPEEWMLDALKKAVAVLGKDHVKLVWTGEALLIGNIHGIPLFKKLGPRRNER